jgi:acetolactate synthase regulatory subunit
MHWTYRITAASKPRVLPRLVQVFAEQSLAIRSLDVALLHQSAEINIAVEADSESAHRLKTTLDHQADVRQVELTLGQAPTAAKAQRQRTRTPTNASIL